MKTLFSNAHTHHAKNTGPALYSPYLPLREKIELDSHTFFTLGIHPWWVQNLVFSDLLALYNEYKNHPQFIGLGEMGLDRLKPHYELQNQIFKQQLDLVMQDDIQRIVVHSVKSTSDLLAYFKQFQYKNKILWHDYRGTAETTQQALRFNSYFSINEHGLKTEVVKHIPTDRLLIETDEKNEINLPILYEKMAKLIGGGPELLQDNINKNFQNFIGE